MGIDSPITTLSGIGEVRAKAFSRLGIFTVGDLLEHYPRSYQDRGNILTLRNGDPERDCSYILTVITEPQLRRIRGNMSILKFRASDNTGICEITYFNQPYYKNQIRHGAKIRFFGRIIRTKEIYKMSNPKPEAIVPGKELENIVPIYPLCEGLTGRIVRDAVSSALSSHLSDFTEYLPEDIRRENSLPTLQFAVREIHRPTDSSSLERAIKRLRFDEMFTFGLAMRIALRGMTKASAPRMLSTDISPFLSVLPFSLTGAQSRALRDIAKDMSEGKEKMIPPMSRIVSGDVGSGKTAVAAGAAFIAVNNGYQAALMAPTEILAAQHSAELSGIFERLGYRTALLTGSTPRSERKKILAALESGDIHLIVGTHALIGEGVRFFRPGLFITDEQHRFGVMQRAALTEKADDAHILVMSATPIPRTLALAIYGDLDLSVLDELPPGRQRVDTFVVDESYRARLDAFIAKQVSEGHQCYIVCPAVEDNSEDDEDGDVGEHLSAATEYSEALGKRLPQVKVGCMHGRLPAAEKDAVMSSFVSGETNVLVSTTVIEVGVNVPNATLMIIENAERFGLSQLHQLRGRVGRGSAKSYCVLVSSKEGQNSRARLDTMRTTYDGYKIAEKDLELRGPGDFFATQYSARQSGGLKFRFAASIANESELKEILLAAERLLAGDPDLSRDENLPLAKRIRKLSEGARGTVN
ncbi:MAG: ATP-dependent DNA helicase RecG [Clostridia bacterium]|nr:ATP-dependent DNA helicase RecG [Clostridia bacterium]